MWESQNDDLPVLRVGSHLSDDVLEVLATDGGFKRNIDGTEEAGWAAADADADDDHDADDDDDADTLFFF